MVGRDKTRLRVSIQSCLKDGVDFYRSRLFDAEQALYDGDFALAVVIAAIALEARLSDFVNSEWRRRGVSKNRLDQVDKEIKLSLMVNVELTALAPDANKPSAELVGALDRTRRIRNGIIHDRKTAVAYSNAKESVESVKQLFEYLKDIS